MSGLRRSTERIARDDRALDAAGAGSDALEQLVRSGGATRDPLLTLLARWHDDVSDGAETALRPAVPPAPADPEADRADGDRPHAPTLHARRRPGRWRPNRLLVAASVAALATAGLGGVALGAAGAGPGSPLWPVTRAVYPDQADSRMHQAAAQRDLDDAQQAVAAGNTADARRYLDDAGHHLAQVKPSAEATRLRERADRMRQNLDAAGAESGNASATPSPSASGKDKNDKGNNGKGNKATPTPSQTDAPSLDAATVPPTASASPSPTPKKVKPSKTKKVK
jgi:hypothetical protein